MWYLKSTKVFNIAQPPSAKHEASCSTQHDNWNQPQAVVPANHQAIQHSMTIGTNLRLWYLQTIKQFNTA
jgi:hypothetical protein